MKREQRGEEEKQREGGQEVKERKHLNKRKKGKKSGGERISGRR